ncbi:MAG TPA: hypothetical protein VGQ64_07465 [Candidatus Limnocylindrales bacterium]|jgi:hypothetical protein|nr:hypothetical protein [Candidatus Limnocylindrales bacterium]
MIGRLALAVTVAILTALSVAGRIDEGLTWTIVFGHSIVGVVSLVVNVVSRRSLRRSIERIRSSTPVVAGGLVEAPPLDVATLIARIRQLGFDLAGATDTTIGGGPIRTWVMLEPTGETWIEIGTAGGPIAIFLSQVTDARLVETSFPTGATIDDPRLLAKPVATSPEDALAEHRKTVAGLGGSRRTVATLDDYLAVELDQRARTGGMRIQDYLDRVVEPSIRDWAISVAVDAVAFVALYAVRAGG